MNPRIIPVLRHLLIMTGIGSAEAAHLYQRQGAPASTAVPYGVMCGLTWPCIVAYRVHDAIVTAGTPSPPRRHDD